MESKDQDRIIRKTGEGWLNISAVDSKKTKEGG